MNLLILGATGGTGRALVDQALAQGHTVTAFARNPAKVMTKHANLRVAKGDIADYSSLEAAIRGQDAVLSALGARVKAPQWVAVIILCQIVAALATLHGPTAWLVRFGIPILANFIIFGRTTVLSDGTRNILRAMQTLGVRRFISESSLGVGDSKGQPNFFFNHILLPIILRNIFADKDVQEKAIQESNLDWILARPGNLTDGPLTRVYKSGFGTNDKTIRGKISRADVADFMLAQLTSNTYLRKTPGLSY